MRRLKVIGGMEAVCDDSQVPVFGGQRDVMKKRLTIRAKGRESYEPEKTLRGRYIFKIALRNGRQW